MFTELLGHSAQKAYLERVIGNQSLAHAYCFSGPKGVGKGLLAREVLKSLAGADLSVYSDFTCIDAAGDTIPVDAIRDMRDHLSMSSFGGGWKLVLIDGADRMNTAAQNALLKTLEEPRGKTLMILIAHDASQLLPTILSRTVHLRFHVLPQEEICRALQEKSMDREMAHVVAEWSAGAPGKAFPLLDEETRAAWQELQASTKQFLNIDSARRLKIIDGWVKEAKEDRRMLYERLGHIQFLLRQALAQHPSKEIARAVDISLATEASLRENGNMQVCLSHLAFNI